MTKVGKKIQYDTYTDDWDATIKQNKSRIKTGLNRNIYHFLKVKSQIQFSLYFFHSTLYSYLK